MKQDLTAFNKALDFIGASIAKIKAITKPQQKFVSWLIERWLLLPVRHNFLNIQRYGAGGYSEKSIREQFSRKINFVSWFEAAMAALKSKECVAAFDPTYIRKSGPNTYGKDWFWSGKDQRPKPGLEIGCLALVDVADATAYSIEAVQTPAATKGELMNHYVSIIKQNIVSILSYTRYLVADGYFMKSSFINPLLALKLQVITRMRPDANLFYLYTGPPKSGRGRKKRYAGKVDVKNIDKQQWQSCYEDDQVQGYELKVWCVALKREVKALYLELKKGKGHTILVSTDPHLAGAKIRRYYQLRFQIEFLIRDAKQHMGLEECQARSETKLYNHFNMALMSVSLMKLTCWANLPDKEKQPFSMRSIKTYCYHKFLTQTIFSNLGLDLSCGKIKQLFTQCLNIGAMAT